MLSAALLLLSNSLFLTLHLSGNPGSFPRPLSRQEERECLEQWAQGDLSARNRLVEHNLRLVAHIIKKYYTQASNQEDLEGREDQQLIRRLVAERLTPREADVIRRRYGLDGHPPQTQRQVAAAYGISRSYVSRIEKRALEKLEAALREHCYP